MSGAYIAGAVTGLGTVLGTVTVGRSLRRVKTENAGRPRMSWKRSLAAWFPFPEFLHRLYWTIEWMRAVHCVQCPIFDHPTKLYAFLHDQILRGGAFDYLEFGVASGTTMRVWCGLNQDTRSRFFGFDSFLGLPEDWNHLPKGTFSQQGIPPEIQDPRVQFEVGWFQDTLPGFLSGYHQQRPLIIHNDSDVYSSTLYLLSMLDRLIDSEVIVIFDEFYDVLHEFRAIVDYCNAYRKRFRIIAATSRFIQAAIHFSPNPPE